MTKKREERKETKMLFDITKKLALVLLGCVFFFVSDVVNAVNNIPDKIKQSVEAQIRAKVDNNMHHHPIVEEAKALVVPPPSQECEDKHLNKIECKEWAWFGECEKNKEFMNESCKQSCGLCPESSSNKSSSAVKIGSVNDGEDNDEDECHDWFATCTEWAEKGNDKVDNLCYGHWNSNKGTWTMTGAYVVEFCPKACKTCDIHLDDRDISALNIGLPQTFPGMENDKELRNLIKGKVAETRAYIESIDNDDIKAVCKMSHPNCARFALSSDCNDQKDHPIMKYGCAAACQTCEDLVNNNGIFEAEHMWVNALRDYNEKKSNVVKKTIGITA